MHFIDTIATCFFHIWSSYSYLFLMHSKHISYAIVLPSNSTHVYYFSKLYDPSCKYIVQLLVYMGVAPSFGIHLILFLSSISLICLYEFVPIYTYLLFHIQSKCLIQNNLC
jgi:hypothetical protein